MIFVKALKKITNYLKFKKMNIKVARGSFVASDVTIGKNTRINNVSYLSSCDIGAYCAIGGRLIVRSTDHETNYLNMQHHFQSKILRSKIKVAGKSKGTVKIGNGVWIGDSVIVLSGVEIGNGAIVGAGSVVTKNIPPYTVAVGNPAKVIRARFDEDISRAIDSLEWWNWTEEKQVKNKFIFETNLNELTINDLNVLISAIKE